MWEGAKKETRVEMVWRVDKVGTSNKRKWLRINAACGSCGRHECGNEANR